MQIRKGQHFSPATEFKKGEHMGANHPNWKGGEVKRICQYCGKDFFTCYCSFCEKDLRGQSVWER